MPDRGLMGEVVTITIVTIVLADIIIEGLATGHSSSLLLGVARLASPRWRSV